MALVILPNVIWKCMFLETQGHPIHTNILYQDNQSAMKIKFNGKLSRGQKSRHVDVPCFFIEYRLST